MVGFSPKISTENRNPSNPSCPTLDSLGQLGLLALIRTFLNYFLGKELETELAMEKEQARLTNADNFPPS